MSEEVLRSARPQGETTLAKALNAGLSDALAADDRVVLMGEDVGTLGGVFRITDGLKAQFGGRRVIDTPLAEWHRRNSDWYGHARVPPVCRNPV